MNIDIKGLITAGFSPFNEAGTLKLKPIAKLVDEQIANGIQGFYLMGSTGEGLSLTIKQRKEITEAYVRAIDKRVLVIVNVSHSSYEVSADLTNHAIACGADAVSATLPAYYNISSINQLTYAIQKIADCQDEIPFIYYHIPGKTGLNFKMNTFLGEIGDRLPQLKGIKYTSGTIDDFVLCQQNYGDRYKMFFGVDELFLPALAIGAECFIGSTYNFMQPLFQNIIKNYAEGDRPSALVHYVKAVSVINTFLKYDGLSAQKAIMKMIGHDFGPPKSPVLSLTKGEYTQLQEDLNRIDYFDLILS